MSLMLLFLPSPASAADRQRCEAQEAALRASAQKKEGWSEEKIEAYVRSESAPCWAEVEAQEAREREAAEEAQREAAEEAAREAAAEAAKEAELERRMEAEREAALEAAYWHSCPAPSSLTGTILVHGVSCDRGRRAIAKFLARTRPAPRGILESGEYACHLRRPQVARRLMCRSGARRILSPAPARWGGLVTEGRQAI